MSKVTTKALASESARGRHGRTIELRQYAVLVDGTQVGTVGQHRVESVTAYAGRMYGYATQRTCWFWNSLDNAGDFEFATRREAIADLVDFVRSA